MWQLCWGALRQLGYPKEFRISTPYQRSVPNSVREDSGLKEPASVPALMTTLDTEIAVIACNEIHKVDRNIQQLRQDGHEMRELARIARSVENVRESLANRGVHSIDLKGQPWEEGRGDFEPLAPPDPVPGLTQVEIIQCERPAIVVHGKLVQRARGILGKPG